MKVIRLTLLLAFFAVTLAPLYLMAMNSLSPARGFLRNPPRILPYEWTLDNYRRALSLPLLPRWLLNSAIVTSVMIGVGVLISSAAGYVFTYARSRWFDAAFWILMTPIFVHKYVLIISQVRIVGILGLEGLPAVLSMSLYWPVGIFLFRNYFKRIPVEIVESARIDGSQEWRTLLQIVLPMARPMVGAAVVFLGVGALGDYVWQMLILQDPVSRTYLVGLMTTAMSDSVVKNIGYDLTVGIMLFVPFLALFAVSSRYFIGGLTGGAIKE